MKVLVILTLMLGLANGPSAAESAQSCADLETKLADLALRVQSLETRLAAMRAAAKATAPTTTTPAPVAPAAAAAAVSPATPPPVAAVDKGREEALALYDRIDSLVATGKVEQARGELSSWDEKHAGTPAAGWTRALNRELAVVGKPAPTDWSIDHWYQGESQVKLDGQRPTLVVFWEAWCPHCKDEVPKLQKLSEQYGSKGLQVVGVTRITQTATEDSVKAFLASSGVRYPMAKETGDLATYFDVKGIPAAALVKDGKVVWRGHPTRLTDELLSTLF